MKYCIVSSAFKYSDDLQKIIDTVLEKKLAASIQTINICSHYTWKDKIYHENEVLVLFKTKTILYEQLKRLLIELHPYETPEIIMTKIDDTSVDFSKWINEVTKLE